MINDDSDLKVYEANKASARSKASIKTKAFVKKVQYQSYLNAGMSPIDAAKKVGIKGLRFWKFYKPGEVERRIEKQIEEGDTSG